MQFTTTFLAAMAMTSASATILARQRDCQALYNQCISSGRAEVACQCDLATCSGEDNARTREYCASATASLAAPSQTSSSPTKSSSSASIIVGTPGSQPSGQAPITAAEGSLALGQTCSDDRQCAGGAQCWGSTAFTIRSCGNFNAACTKDSQCAFNTCNNGLCNGFKQTSTSSVVVPATTLATKASSTAVTSEGKACRVHTVYV